MDREWYDFIVYNRGEVVVDWILVDLDYWNTLKQNLEKFYTFVMSFQQYSLTKYVGRNNFLGMH